MIPVVTAFDDAQGKVAALDDDDILDGRAVLHRIVSIVLQRQQIPSAVAAVGRDEELGLGIEDAVLQRIRAETAEDHRMHRSDPGARQHGDRRLGNHRKVDGHAVAFAYAERLEHIGEFVDVAVQVPIGQRALVSRLTLPDDRCLVLSRALDVPIHAIEAGVDLSTHKPLGVRRLPLKHFLPGLRPGQLFGKLLPEFLRVAGSFGVNAGVSYQRMLLKGFWSWKATLLSQQIGQGRIRTLRRFLFHLDTPSPNSAKPSLKMTATPSRFCSP